MKHKAVNGQRRPQRAAESGGAAVEFALVLPLFMALVMGALDYGYFFFSQQVVTNAAREGARAGTLVNPNTDTSTAGTNAKATALAYMNANSVGCPGGGDACIQPGFPNVTAPAGCTAPAITCPTTCVRVFICYPSVSLTGFTSIVLPSVVQANSVMSWSP